MNNIIYHDKFQRVEAAVFAPLVTLITALDGADLHNEDLPLAMLELLEHFLDPDVQAALPTVLRVAADTYLDSLHGYRAGDFKRATEQHGLRLALWDGEAFLIEEVDIEELGLEETRDG